MRSLKLLEHRWISRLRETGYVAVLESLNFVRDPWYLGLATLLSFAPAIVIILFAGIQPSAAVGALLGATIVGLVSISVLTGSQVFMEKGILHLKDIYVASSLHPSQYAFGIALSTLITAGPGLVLGIGIVYAISPIPIVPVLSAVAVLLLLWLMFSSLGFAFGLSARTARGAQSMPLLVAYLVGFLPPVYYPLSRLPAWSQELVLLIPTVDAAQLVKADFGTVALLSTGLLFAWAWLVILTISLALLSWRFARWVDR